MLLYFLFLALLFFRKTKHIFLSCGIGFYRSQSQHIAAQASQALAKVQHVRLCCGAFIAKAGIACELWCPYIVRHRVLLRVLLTHLWKVFYRPEARLIRGLQLVVCVEPSSRDWVGMSFLSALTARIHLWIAMI